MSKLMAASLVVCPCSGLMCEVGEVATMKDMSQI